MKNKKNSLRIEFILQLALTSTMLIAIFSTIFYYYIKFRMLENVSITLSQEASLAIQNSNFSNILLEEAEEEFQHDHPVFKKVVDNNKTYLVLTFTHNDNVFKLAKDISEYELLIKQILVAIFFISAFAVLMIIFYALFISKILLIPIRSIGNEISKRNESSLEKIDLEEIPKEFEPLALSINRLIERIHNFIKYQKELFIGIAHELKTPLAVMKTKNEVTLIKKRDTEKYIEAIRNCNKEIDLMNKMISQILEIGRQEGAQFENAVKKDIVEHLKSLIKNFQILAKLEKKEIKADLQPESLVVKFQPTLFMHIIQNFLQNAIKFSEKQEEILITSFLEDENFIVEVMNKAEKINENIDYFVPFKRYGNKSGSGLGLFLAKSAADAMNAKISLRNHQEEDKIIARFALPL